jgi:tRNA A37 threonylcarbamoyltransferase TsaD
MRGKNRWRCDLSFSGLKTAVLYATRDAAEATRAEGGSCTGSSLPAEGEGAVAGKFARPREDVPAFARELEELRSVDDLFAFRMAASFQEAALTHIAEKTEAAIACARELLREQGSEAAETTKLDTLIVCGGVACNASLRARIEALAERETMRAVFPPLRLCTDNGAMIAWAAAERLNGSNFDHAVPALDTSMPGKCASLTSAGLGSWYSLHDNGYHQESGVRPRWPLQQCSFERRTP